MVAKRISAYLTQIKNFLPSNPTSFAYILMGLGILFLLSAVAHNGDKLDAYVCLSSFASFTFLMSSFVVAVHNLEDVAE